MFDDRLRKEDWFVAPCPLKSAQEMVVGFHYAKGGSNTACYTHGLYLKSSGELHGIAWWLPPTRVAAESVNRRYWKQVLSLTRMVLLPGVPKNACSFLLAKSVKLIKQDKRFVSLVTYADESQGHTGRVYAASNWAYVGRTGPYPRWLTADGMQVAPKATTSRTKAEMRALGHVLEGRYFKHKYVLHLNGEPEDLSLI